MKLKALAITLLLAAPAVFAQSSIKTVRMEPIDSPCCSNSPGEDKLLTEKIVSSLVAHGDVVLDGESDHPTDAVLHVTYTVDQYGKIHGPARLTDVSGTIVWAGEARTPPFARSASSSFADEIAKQVEAFLSGKRR
jgi:hypothetical protein